MVTLVAPACQAIGARAYNLGELHEENGHHKRSATLMSDTEYLLRRSVLSMLRKDGAGELGKSATKIEDPLETCVEILIALSEIEPGDEARAAQQLETFARLSAIDPWHLSRRICLHEVGRAGARLGMESHPPAAEPAGEVATPDALRAALAPLIHALVPSTELEARADVAAACRGLTQLHYDLDGILRALAASRGLLDRQAAASPNRAPLLELVLDLERRTVRMCIERGFTDSHPDVRASAVEAGVRAEGRPFLSKLVPRLGTDGGEEVPLAILAMLRSLGLSPIQPGENESQSAREGELALLMKVATEHPIERVRVGAMLTLGKVAGAGFNSLRAEDWDTWWYSRPTHSASE